MGHACTGLLPDAPSGFSNQTAIVHVLVVHEEVVVDRPHLIDDGSAKLAPM